jgi:hypothetical protein
MSRTIESIKENEVVWCKSPEEAKEFCKLLAIAGKRTRNGDSYAIVVNNHIGELCYNISRGACGDRPFYEQELKIITPATEFIEDQQSDPILTPDHLGIYKQGQEAKKEGIPKSDNPYIGVVGNAEKIWSDGYESVNNLVKISYVQVKSVPYQLCPMCHGEKQIVSSLRRSQDGQVQSSITIKCHICKGEGIIPQFVIE